MANVLDFDLIQVVFQGSEATITRPDFLAWLSANTAGDTDTYATASQAAEAGTDVTGKAYYAGDWILTFASGQILSLASSTDQYATAADAATAGTDTAGVDYPAGAKLLILPNGDTYVVGQGDGAATAAPATADGTDSAGNTYSAGDVIVTLADGSTFVVTQPTVDAAECCVKDPLRAPAESWSGLCGDPNIIPVGADGDRLIDITVNPINTYVAESGSWDLIPRGDIPDGVLFSCTNIEDVFMFSATADNWVPADPALAAFDENDPTTWGVLSDPYALQIVYNSAGDVIGVVDQTGGHALAHPVATTDIAGIVELATDAEAQAGTDDTRAVTPASLAAALGQINDLHSVGWDSYDAATNTLTLRMSDGTTLPVDLSALINDAVSTVPPATDSQSGIVELATTAETEAGTDSTRAVTPQGLKDALGALICATPDATQAQLDAADDTDYAMICVDGELAKVQLGALAQLLSGTSTAGLYPEWFNTVAGDRSMVVDYDQSDISPNPNGVSFTVGPDGAYIKLFAAQWYENDSTGAVRSVTARQWFARVQPGDVVTIGTLATGKIDVNGAEWVGNDYVARQPLIDALVYTAPTEWTANGRVYGKFLDGTIAVGGFNGPSATTRFMPRYLDTDLPGTTEPHTGASAGSDIEQVADGGAPLSLYDGLEKEQVVYQRQQDVIGGSRTIPAAVNELETYYFGGLVKSQASSGGSTGTDYTKIGAIVYKASGYREPTGYLDNQTAFDRGGNADVPGGGLT